MKVPGIFSFKNLTQRLVSVVRLKTFMPNSCVSFKLSPVSSWLLGEEVESATTINLECVYSFP